MFAPPSGRYLLLSVAGLGVLSFAVADRWVVPTPASLGLLVLGWGLWGFLVIFFRDPERRVGPGIVAPADGRVREVQRGERLVRISIFMNVTDVHVNRFPLEGRVESIENRGRGFRPAFSESARHNRQRSYGLSTEIGPVEVVQMTGFLARRLVSLVDVGAHRPKGSRLGMILLGSRVDLILPAARVETTVAVGDRVRAGETTVAREHP